MLKLVVTDVDGTLMNDSCEVPKDIFNLIDSLHYQNIDFAIASGRQFNDLKRIMHGRDDIYYIAQNGAHIEYKGDILHEEYISESQIRSIIDLAYELKLFPMFYGETTLYILDSEPTFIQKLKKYKVDYTLVQELPSNSRFGKISLMSLGDDIDEFKAGFTQVEGISIYVSCKDLIDINMTNTNKGNAISFLQNKLHISPNETVAFGDAENDIPLFKYSTYSYAMDNADDIVKEHANYLAPSNNDEAVVTILREMLESI